MYRRGALIGVLALAVVMTPMLVVPGVMHGFELPKVVTIAATCAVLMVLVVPDVAAIWRRSERPVRWLLALTVLFTVWMLVATATSDVPVLSVLGQEGRFVGTVVAVFPAALVLAVPIALTDRADLDRGLLLLAGTLGAIATYGVVQFLGLDPMPWRVPFGGRPVATFGNSNFVGAVLCLTVPLAAWLWVRSPRTRWAAAVLLLTGGVTLWAAEARLGWAAAGVGLGLLLVLTAPRVPPSLKPPLLAATPLASTVLGVLTIGVGVLAQDGTSLARLAYWRSAVPMWLDNPVLGVGLGRFAAFHRAYRPPSSVLEFGVDLTVDSSHLWALDLAATTGTLGAVLWLAILVAAGIVLRSAWRRTDDPPELLRIALVAGMLAAHGMQSAMSVPTIVSVWIGWLILGAVVAVSATSGKTRRARRSGIGADRSKHRAGARTTSSTQPAPTIAAATVGVIVLALGIPVLRSAHDVGRSLSMAPEVRADAGLPLLMAATARTEWWPEPWHELADLALLLDAEDLSVAAVQGGLTADPRSTRSVVQAIEVAARWEGVPAAEPWVLRLRELDPVGRDTNLTVASWAIAVDEFGLAEDALNVASQHMAPGSRAWNDYQELRASLEQG